MPDLDRDLDETIEFLRRFFGKGQDEPQARDWYKVQAKASSRKAEVRIYDDIGWFGTSAKAFAREIDALDVDEIDLRLNSPGGAAWDGVTIYNSLRKHKAKVTVTVDGMAASAASVIAMAGEKVLMNRGTQMMIHDAWGLAIGNPRDMEKAREALDKLSDSLADIYAARAGGTAAEWRDAMREESWYTAAEAVDAGLADESVDDVRTAEPAAKAQAGWDLTAFAFAYAGRDKAPPPKITRRPTPPQIEAPAPSGALPSPAPVTAAEAAARIHAASTKTPDASPAAGPPNNPEGAAEMQFTDEERTALRARFNLSADAGDDAIKAALLAPPSPPDNTQPKTETTAASTAMAAPPGTMLVSESNWQQMNDQLKALAAFVDQTKRNERDGVIDQAIRDGKFTPAQKAHFAKLWDSNPDGTRAVIDSMQRNSAFAVEAVGYANGEGDDFEREYQQMVAQLGGRRS